MVSLSCLYTVNGLSGVRKTFLAVYGKGYVTGADRALAMGRWGGGHESSI